MFSRRRFLQSSAAGVGALALSGSQKQPAAAALSATPRVVFVIEGNGIYGRAFMSDATRAEINRHTSRPLAAQMITDPSYGHATPLMIPPGDIATAASLAPLAAANLQNKAAVLLGLSCKIAGGGHSSHQGGLACARGNAAAPPAITIDAALAARLQGQTPFDAIRLGIDSPTTRLAYATCAYGLGRPAVISTNPVDAYNRLFSAIVGGASDPRVAKRAAAFAFAKADAGAAIANAAALPASERAKLMTYQQAAMVAEQRQARLIALAGSVTAPPAPTGQAGDPYTDPDPLIRLGVQFDLAAAALIGELSNVAVIASGPGGGLSLNYQSVFQTVPNWPAIDMGMDRHTLQHGIQIPIHQEAILAVTRKHVELVASFAAKLDAVTVTGGGTLLDHTAIVVMSDNGEQHHSEGREWPILVLGGSKLGLGTDGRTIVYPKMGEPNNRQLSNLWNTLGHATGDPTLNTFGLEGSLRVAPGPLAEFYTPV